MYIYTHLCFLKHEIHHQNDMQSVSLLLYHINPDNTAKTYKNNTISSKYFTFVKHKF